MKRQIFESPELSPQKPLSLKKWSTQLKSTYTSNGGLPRLIWLLTTRVQLLDDDQMEFDAQVAIERVQSEGMRLFDMPKSVDFNYFSRYRDAVQSAADFFESGSGAPLILLQELKQVTQIIRNESTVFEERRKACLEMAEWLETIYTKLSR